MGNTTKKICVAGSLNVDLTLRLERFHQPGETVIAKSIHTYAGGKGGNQAVAVAKLGHPVMMVGMLGEDDNGRFYRDTLKKNGVDAECVGSAPNTPSGTAVIEVDDRGENRIAIIPGTNGLVNNAYMDSVMERMLTCDIFMLQYEIDLATDAYLAKILHDAGKQLILDPAPAAPAPDGLYANIDFINFEGEPTTNRTGTLYIYADEDSYIYEVTSKGAKKINGAYYDDDEEAWVIRTRNLTSYAISDKKLKTVDQMNNGSSSSSGSKPGSNSGSGSNNGKPNPDTGR